MSRFIYITIVLHMFSFSQEKSTIKKADNFIYEGNTEFDNSNNIKAEKNYRRALSTGVKKNTANYNIANVLQEQDYLDEAIINYFDVISASKSKTNKHKSYHNIGNAFMENKNYKAAVEAYKNALRNNPADDESRYNYALAKKMLDDEQNKNDKEPQDKDQKDKDQKDKDQKDKDQQNKDDKKNKSDKEDGEDESKENNDRPNENPKDSETKTKASPTELSSQEIKNLLEAMNKEENKVQKKVKASKIKPASNKKRKDW
ncbi:MAG: tetratricopeptide repeat protein [Bacteroidota bacterium]|nr:tetratricopeptide repeat protein [Bacteroidota bacterium]